MPLPDSLTRVFYTKPLEDISRVALEVVRQAGVEPIDPKIVFVPRSLLDRFRNKPYGKTGDSALGRPMLRLTLNYEEQQALGDHFQGAGFGAAVLRPRLEQGLTPDGAKRLMFIKDHALCDAEVSRLGLLKGDEHSVYLDLAQLLTQHQKFSAAFGIPPAPAHSSPSAEGEACRVAASPAMGYEEPAFLKPRRDHAAIHQL